MNVVDLYNMDCRDAMSLFLPDNSVDAIVCDPPYGLAFMGKKWDYDVPGVDIWAECLRVLKPGGHLLAFAGTRTQHRMAVRIEDAGFEIRDMIAWVYSQGFPKSLDVSKAIDKAAGAEREVVGRSLRGCGNTDSSMHKEEGFAASRSSEYDITAPATDAARQWDGWGTALKPALEPITMARKPLGGAVAANVLAHGTGALNIDGCRVGDEVRFNAPAGNKAGGNSLNMSAVGMPEDADGRTVEGRWPANIIHDGSSDVVAAFPQAKGQQGALTGSEPSSKTANTFGEFAGRASSAPRGDTGSAARFFMQCKGDYNDAWQDLNLPQENANTAEQSSSPQRQAAVSALVLAVSSALPEGLLCSSLFLEPSTSATGIELKLIAESVTQTILNIEPRFWRASKPTRLSLTHNPVNVAVHLEPTGTTTITVSRWKSDGSAEPVTFSITPMSLEVGGKDCAPSMDGKRFMYCAKASKKDRGDGNGHPTVKPTDLMAYLCRLVTPPGGVVLDPFMGSGSTGKAALREGFGFIGCEMDAAYFAIAEARLAAVKVAA